MPKKPPTDWTESTRPGTVYRVFEQYKKAEYDASGRKPVIIKPDVIEKKVKNKSLN